MSNGTHPDDQLTAFHASLQLEYEQALQVLDHFQVDQVHRMYGFLQSALEACVEGRWELYGSPEEYARRQLVYLADWISEARPSADRRAADNQT